MHPTSLDNGIAEIGALMGDPARAHMIVPLMTERARTATQLAYAVSRQTASGQVERLRQANLFAVEKQG